MDLTIDVEGYKLNIRVAGIIIHNNMILLHKNMNKEYYTIIGGRVKIGEDSKKALKRELEEELGKEVCVGEFWGVIENFFIKDNIKYHEIIFIYRAEFKNKTDRLLNYTIKNNENKSYLNYYWIDINKLNDYTIVPNAIKKVFEEKKYPFSKIVHDI